MSDSLALSGAEARPVAPRPRRRRRPAAWMGWLLPLVLLALWQAAASTGMLSSSILPNPLDIGRAAYRLTLDGELAANLETSALRALAGLVVGGGIGLAFGIANGLSRWSDAFTDTTLQMVRNVPHLALIPLVILWFGIDEGAKLFLVALGVFFPIYLNTLHGIRDVDPQLVEMARSYGMGSTQLFRRVIWPSALPSIFVGAALCARHHLAHADRRRDHRRAIGHRLHGHAGARVHADRRHRPRHPDLRRTRQGRRFDRARPGAPLPQVEPRLREEGGGMSVATLKQPSAAPAIERGRPLAITSRGLAKSFGDRAVISHLDLHVPAGQFLAIVGRSGCGKSTLLRLLTGLERPDAGTVQAGDAAVGPPARSRTRLMFQEPRLLPWATVIDNVAVGAARTRPEEARERAAAALADVGLADRAAAWPATLSGGQKQRVALARALVSGPSILALDEPLGALDALTRLDMQALIERIFLTQGFTAILVTHDVGEAVALADRVVVLDEGRIALDVEVRQPRPRRRGDPDAIALEQRILSHLLAPQPAQQAPH